MGTRWSIEKAGPMIGLMLGCAVLCPTPATGAAVEFHKSLESAWESDQRGRPMVVVFGASWCGWCRKMSVETFAHEKVKALQDKFLWVKLDADKDKEIAALFRAPSVPYTVVLDAEGRLLGARGGFLSPDKMVEFLTDSLEQPVPGAVTLVETLSRLRRSETAEQHGKLVGQLIDRLAEPSRFGRKAVLASLRAKGSSIWPVLAESMADDRLAVRAAAAGALRHCSGENLPFLPFAPAEVRRKQHQAWNDWIKERAAAATPEP
ncbi:MAG: thioredoxin family protein [Planctomycetales bacterium]